MSYFDEEKKPEEMNSQQNENIEEKKEAPAEEQPVVTPEAEETPAEPENAPVENVTEEPAEEESPEEPAEQQKEIETTAEEKTSEPEPDYYQPVPEFRNEPREEKNNKKGVMISGPAIAILLVCIIIFSAVIGIGGWKIYEYMSSEPTTTNSTINTQGTTPIGTDSTNQTEQTTVATEGTTAVPVGDSSIKDVIINPEDTITSDTRTTETDLITRCMKSCVEIELYYSGVRAGAGSGVIYTKNGYIITNYHVASDTVLTGYDILVRLSDGTEYDAVYVCGDVETDIAVIKINKDDCDAAVIGNSDATIVGERIYCIGNPNAEGLYVTDGLISAKGRSARIRSSSVTLFMDGMFEISAPINAGNSGGGLFNINGDLIGIVNAKLYYDKSGNATEGRADAIPIAKAIACLKILGENDGYIPGRAKLGVTVNTSGITISSGYTSYTYACNVTSVQSGSNAEKAGIEVGDIIIAIGDVNLMSYYQENGLISDYDALHHILSTYKAGDSTTITVLRPETSSSSFGYSRTTYTQVELEITFNDFNYSKIEK